MKRSLDDLRKRGRLAAILPTDSRLGGIVLKLMIAATLVFVVSFWTEKSLSDTGGECPVTRGTDKLLGKPFPESGNWYGSEALAVALPADGIWGVTGPSARIAVKLFWRSAGFRPGMGTNLKVEITNLDGRPNDAVVKDITTANSVPEDWEKAHSDDEWLGNACWNRFSESGLLAHYRRVSWPISDICG